MSQNETLKNMYNIIQDNYKHMARTPEYGFPLACGEGWYGIVESTLNYLNKLCNDYKGKVYIDDIKEKYGTLRLYIGTDSSDVVNDDDADKFHSYADNIVRGAEEASALVCERCGTTMYVRLDCINGWWSTLCTKCKEEREHGDN